MSVYNGQAYLREAVESILGQTYTDFEFLIVDDGSTDATWSILSSYRDARMRLVSNERNIGLARSLNRGLALARGEYVARQDADDVSLPERFATQVAYLDSDQEVGLVSANCYLMDAAGTAAGGPILTQPLSGALVEWRLFWGNPVVHPSVMCRTRVMRACGGYPEQYSYYAEDYALWLKMVTVTKVVVLQQPLLRLRKHQRNVTMQTLNDHLEEVLGVAQAALQRRIGYAPDKRIIRILRGLPVDPPPSRRDIGRAVNLLLDAYVHHVHRCGLKRKSAHLLRADLSRRLKHLVGLYSVRPAVAAVCAVAHSPRVLRSPIGLRAVLEVASGRLSARLARCAGWLHLEST
jgi:glycosyltransferase involved in cell wall biosynthesis